jgi:hypothetical protein
LTSGVEYFFSVYKITSNEDKHRVSSKINCACHARFRLSFFIEKSILFLSKKEKEEVNSEFVLNVLADCGKVKFKTLC